MRVARMLVLVRCLLLYRWRKLRRERGLLAMVSQAGLFSVLVVLAAGELRSLLHEGPTSLTLVLVRSLWLSLFGLALLTGVYPMWRIDLSRLLWWPGSFVQLYLVVGLGVGALSLPMLLGTVGLEIAVGRLDVLSLLGSGAAWFFLVLNSRLPASCLRLAGGGRGALGPASRFAGAFFGLISPVLWLWGEPGESCGFLSRWTAAVLGGSDEWVPWLGLLIVTVFYVGLDLVLQERIATYGLSSQGRRSVAGLFPALNQSRLSELLPPLWDVCLRGFWRIHSARWLWLFGFSYPLIWQTFAQKEAPLFTVLAYAGMVSVFQSAYRGNMLGMDRRGVLAYPLMGCWGVEVLRAKNRALTLFHVTMMSGAFLPALLPGIPHMQGAKPWICAVTFAVASVLLSEAAGAYFSVRYPEAIDPKSRYSAGTSPGALTVGTVHVVLTVMYVILGELVLPRMTTEAAVVCFALPVLAFSILREAAYRRAAEIMWDNAETVFGKLWVLL